MSRSKNTRYGLYDMICLLIYINHILNPRVQQVAQDLEDHEASLVALAEEVHLDLEDQEDSLDNVDQEDLEDQEDPVVAQDLEDQEDHVDQEDHEDHKDRRSVLILFFGLHKLYRNIFHTFCLEDIARPGKIRKPWCLIILKGSKECLTSNVRRDQTVKYFAWHANFKLLSKMAEEPGLSVAVN